MSEVNGYPHGTFSWADLSTTDAAAARTFYCGLFGWDAQDNEIPGGGVYTMLLQDGKNVCALSQMGQELMDSGMPSAWYSYITVADIDAVTAKVADLGGTVMEGPFDVMDAGRMSFIQDPTGGMVCLWQTRSHRGADIFNVPYALGWNELATRDAAAAKVFYTELLGWAVEVDDNNYHMWLNDGRPNGGMMQMDENWPADIPPHWAVYFSVEDIHATTAKAKKLGGTVMMEPFEAGEVGKVAVLADPTGASFYAIQMNAPDTTLPGE